MQHSAELGQPVLGHLCAGVHHYPGDVVIKRLVELCGHLGQNVVIGRAKAVLDLLNRLVSRLDVAGQGLPDGGQRAVQRGGIERL